MQYIWSHGRCRMCDAKSKSTPRDAKDLTNKPLSPLRRHNIPARTKKRLNEESLYSKIINTMDKQKGITCFFCGGKMGKPEDHHHLMGRDGALLYDRKYIVHAHRECHKMYHDVSASKIPWFLEYVNRVSDIDTDLAEREMMKLSK